MNSNKPVVGHDSDGMWKFIWWIIIIGVTLAIIVYGGAFIGGFFALKNYFTSFWDNVIVSNRKVEQTA